MLFLVAGDRILRNSRCVVCASAEQDEAFRANLPGADSCHQIDRRNWIKSSFSRGVRLSWKKSS